MEHRSWTLGRADQGTIHVTKPADWQKRYVISGPLIDGIRKRRYSSDRSLGKRILGLPVVRLFVPLPMPYPPGGGKYFQWGGSNRPWTSIANAGGGAGAGNPINHEPQATLISINR